MSKMQVKRFEDIFHRKLTIKELVNGFYEDTQSGKVTAFNGQLNIRPPYQREFIYEIDKQKAVINTVLNSYPLNVMYWAETDDGTYELMDGQQRTLSICKFHDGSFSISSLDADGKVIMKTFDFLKEQADDFLNYPLDVYICKGDHNQKMTWFRIINIAGIKLTEQEMLNAIYNSPWVTDAKRYFSRLNGEGYASEGHVSNGHTYGDYIDVDSSKTESEKAVVRQKLLEIVLNWAVDRENKVNNKKINVETYMLSHRGESNAKDLWRYYEDVMEWVKSTFPTYHSEMKKVQWGELYNDYHEAEIENADEKVNKIFEYENEISNKKDIYLAVLSNNLKYLNPRSFNKVDIKDKLKEQNNKCMYCHGELDDSNCQGDHIIPWSKGGKTNKDNLQILCQECNIKKSNYDVRFTPWDKSEYKKFDLSAWDKYLKK